MSPSALAPSEYEQGAPADQSGRGLRPERQLSPRRYWEGWKTIEGVAGRASNRNDRAVPKVPDDVGYNPTDRADHPADRRAADLALQLRLGLLPERRRRASGDRAHYPAAGRTTLS